jgi:hypothetical protein
MSAQFDAAWLTLGALAHTTTRWCDRHFIVGARQRGQSKLAADDVRKIELLAWRYRKVLPRHLAPTLPPYDPIVRALKQEAAHV